MDGVIEMSDVDDPHSHTDERDNLDNHMWVFLTYELSQSILESRAAWLPSAPWKAVLRTHPASAAEEFSPAQSRPSGPESYRSQLRRPWRRRYQWLFRQRCLCPMVLKMEENKQTLIKLLHLQDYMHDWCGLHQCDQKVTIQRCFY